MLENNVSQYAHSIHSEGYIFVETRMMFIREMEQILARSDGECLVSQIQRTLAEYVLVHKNDYESDREAFVSALSYLFYRTSGIYIKDGAHPEINKDIEQHISTFYFDTSAFVRAEAARSIPVYEMTYGPLIELHLMLANDNSVQVRACIVACIARDFAADTDNKLSAEAFDIYQTLLSVLMRDSEVKIAEAAREQMQIYERKRKEIEELRRNELEEEQEI